MPVHITGGDVDAGTDYDLFKIHDVSSGTALRLNTQADASLFEVTYTGTVIGNSYTLPHAAPAEGQLLTRATGAGAGVLSWEDPAAVPFTADLDDVLNNTTGNATTQALTTGVFKATSININSAFTFPTADGTSDQVLQTDGNGNVTWADAGGGTDDQTLDEVLTEGSTSTQTATLGGLVLDTTVADGSDPEQILIRNTSASPAIDDVIGSLVFKGDNVVGTEVEFGRIRVDANAVTNGGERGELSLQVRNSGGSLDAQIKVNGVVSFYDDAYSFPTTDGNANQALFTNGSGVISWTESVALLLAPTASGSGQIPMTVAGNWYPSFWTLPTTGGTTNHVLTMTGTGVSGWQALPTALNLDTTTDNGATTENSIEVGGLTVINDEENGAPVNNIIIKNTTTTPADDDIIGKMAFLGKNDASEDVEYMSIFGGSLDVTDGAEDGAAVIYVMDSGTPTEILEFSYRDGISFYGNKYTFPDVAPTEGQMLQKASSGNDLEWANYGSQSNCVQILNDSLTQEVTTSAVAINLGSYEINAAAAGEYTLSGTTLSFDNADGNKVYEVTYNINYQLNTNDSGSTRAFAMAQAYLSGTAIPQSIGKTYIREYQGGTNGDTDAGRSMTFLVQPTVGQGLTIRILGDNDTGTLTDFEVEYLSLVVKRIA